MAAVTASTKSESPRIEWAGVDTGAKIFVGLREPSAGAARAATGTQRRTMTCTANRKRQMAELLFRISFTSSQFTQERANQLVAKPNGLRPSKPLRCFRASGLAAATSGKCRVYSDPARSPHTIPRSPEHFSSADPGKKEMDSARLPLRRNPPARPAFRRAK